MFIPGKAARLMGISAGWLTFVKTKTATLYGVMVSVPSDTVNA
jgi:hypothetical protein